jgi:2-polyprenyl-6-hydroxyphenyl methylase/3-demethylubiquinone-9 3-methyltransferase
MQEMSGISYEYRNTQPEASHGYLYPVIDPLLSHLPAGSSVLDLGCGNGTFLALFRDRGWKLYGTDFSPTGIAIAQQNFPEIQFFLADSTSPAGDILERVGPVDLILSTEVIEHLYDPRGFLRNAHQLLKPGGTLILSTPYHGYFKNLMLALTGKLDRHFTVLWDHGHIKFWSRKTLTQALQETGFTEIKFAGAGRAPFFWKSMVMSAKRA